MCGRITYADSETSAAAFEASIIRHHFTPRFNAAPTVNVPIVALAPSGQRFLALLKWGLVPNWSASAKPKIAPFNAVSEEVHWKPMFRDAWAKGQRCLVAVTGWYEWPKKVPHYIRREDERPFALAGLWDVWTDGTEKVVSCTILTCPPTPFLKPFHHRMPVLIRPADYDTYLDPDRKDLGRLLTGDATFPLVAFPVSTKVSYVRNEGPELVEPVAIPA